MLAFLFGLSHVELDFRTNHTYAYVVSAEFEIHIG